VVFAMVAVYLAIASWFLLSAMRAKLSSADIVLSLLWPLPVAFSVAFLLMSWTQSLDT
jgi:hypothetical protein